MDFNQKLENYSDIIIKKGINLKKGQKLEIRASIDDADFARILMKKAFDNGASDVNIDWTDYISRKIKFQNAPSELFDEVAVWEVSKMNYYCDEKWNLISITAPDPEVLKEVNPEVIGKWMKSRSKAFERMKKLQMSFDCKWVIALGASAPWAKKVFPDLTADEAVEKLWDYIFKTTRTDSENYEMEWNKHLTNLKSRCEKLNAKKYNKLIYKGPGTNLNISLAENSRWIGGDTLTPDGTNVLPNIPTEEIFTVPHKFGVNGRVQSTMPLVYNGNIIKNMWLEFSEGKVINFGADSGRDLLKTFIDTDNGSCYLGEVALVPVDSPISRLNTLFYNTLFDENASCHLALGNALSMCMHNNIDNLSDEDKDKIGFNVSNVHQDFMIGSNQLNIYGVLDDGTEELIFKNGNWAN